MGMKTPKIDFTGMARSRLKVTFIFGGFGMVGVFFTMFMIWKASEVGQYDVVAAWSSLGSIYVATLAVSGYYLSRETQRPSLLSNTFVGMADVEKRILDGEDESDPESIPL
jgi:hypothetical protein